MDELRKSAVDPDPLEQFRRWYADAEGTGIKAPQAMALATSTADGAPSVRMVLLKGADERGFVFFTGYVSRKAGELDTNPRAALLAYWDPLGRQVRIDGTVARVSREESREYFSTRPLESRLSALASRQSEVIESREALEARVEELRARYPERDVPLPPTWGGYRLSPSEYEFWQHQDNRLHDRLRYRRVGEAWIVERLQP